MEALALLVAVRVWRPVWCLRPTLVVVRSDSTAALAALEKLRSRNGAMNRVARELAIEISFSPTGLSFQGRHVRGKRNEWADALSRIAQPGSGAVVPGPLRGLTQRVPEDRGSRWWRASSRLEISGQVRDVTDKGGSGESTEEVWTDGEAAARGEEVVWQGGGAD